MEAGIKPVSKWLPAKEASRTFPNGQLFPTKWVRVPSHDSLVVILGGGGGEGKSGQATVKMASRRLGGPVLTCREP